MTRSLLVTAALGLTLGFASCASNPFSEDRETQQQAGGEVQLNTQSSEEHGTFITDSEGRALYLFKADTQGISACYDQCAEAWPPLLAGGNVSAEGEELQNAMISTIQRDDGSIQVAYNGWPLYYYQGDNKAGDTMGQDVMGFGAEWYLVSPDGKPAKSKDHKKEM